MIRSTPYTTIILYVQNLFLIAALFIKRNAAVAASIQKIVKRRYTFSSSQVLISIFITLFLLSKPTPSPSYYLHSAENLGYWSMEHFGAL